MHQSDTPQHVPVLLDAVLHYLQPRAGENYLDVTAGYGGHAGEVMACTHNPAGMTLVDRDPNAIAVLRTVFPDIPPAEIRQTDFYATSLALASEQRRYDMILADLGVSSPHMDEADRGFSISRDGPLDMRMDSTQPLTAADIVNTYTEAAIAKILKQYGEEPKATAIARLIVHNRPLRTTHQLADVVKKAWPGHSHVHPATRTFQALRIAINDEIGLLERSIPIWLSLLKPAGRLVVISFHSLEDRVVKRAFHDVAGNRYDADFTELTKRPVTASASELVFNPRARSAKLRAVVKNKQ